MSKVTNRMKLAWFKGMEALGTSASHLASNAKYKAQEIRIEARRREILTEFSMKAFDLWQEGETLPGPLEDMLKELSELNEKLSNLRALRYAVAGQNVEMDGETMDADTRGTNAQAPSEAVPEAAGIGEKHMGEAQEPSAPSPSEQEAQDLQESPAIRAEED